MFLFFVGILEMAIVATWTKTVSDTQVVASGVITMVNVLIWFYVLQRILEDVTNWQVMVMYALGCAIGTMLSTAYYRRQANKVSSV